MVWELRVQLERKQKQLWDLTKSQPYSWLLWMQMIDAVSSALKVQEQWKERWTFSVSWKLSAGQRQQAEAEVQEQRLLA